MSLRAELWAETLDIVSQTYLETDYSPSFTRAERRFIRKEARRFIRNERRQRPYLVGFVAYAESSEGWAASEKGFRTSWAARRHAARLRRLGIAALVVDNPSYIG